MRPAILVSLSLVKCPSCPQCWQEMEQRLHLGDPSPGSEREEAFNSGLKVINAKVQQILRERTEGQNVKELPFIDALLQSAVPEEQVMVSPFFFP